MRSNRLFTLLRRYGRTVTLHRGGLSYPLTAFITPLLHRNRDYLEDRYSALGSADQNAFYCYAITSPAISSLQLGDLIDYQQETLLVSASEQLVLHDQTVFLWAMLRRAHPQQEVVSCKI